VQRAEGLGHRFERGPTGRVIAEQLPGGGVRKYRHDLAGQLIELTRANGAVSRYTYDARGRLTQAEHSDGEREHFEYRADGALLMAANGSCELRFERDAHGRVIREWQGERWVESHHDEHGRRSSLATSFGLELQLTRDALGEVTALESERPALDISRRLDAAGRELERLLSGGIRSRYKRDKLGRPRSHEILDGARALLARSYNWDAGQRLLMEIDAEHGPTRYGYDARAQLLWAEHAGGQELHVPDALGNVYRSRDFSDRRYGRGGELLEAKDAHGGIVRFVYDAENNLVEKREPSGRTERYFWSASGQLVIVMRADGSRLQLQYDALGRRVAKTFRGLTTHYLWDGEQPLHEWVDGQLEPLPGGAPAAGPRTPAAVQREAELSALMVQDAAERGNAPAPIGWLFEPDGRAPLARLHGQRVQYVLCDFRGTPCSLVDEDGRAIWSAALTSYGELRELRGARSDCPFRRIGEYEDLETGLYYARDHYYDPETGQIIGPRPIGLTGAAAQRCRKDPLAYLGS
jgi:RHS repeat-associated protein